MQLVLCLARRPSIMPRDRSSRCLIVEDNVVVGMDLEDELQRSGFEVHWVASVKGALAALDQGRTDVAVLDVVMRGEPCTALVLELKRRTIPFVIHSGWARREQTPAVRDAPWIVKPAAVAALTEALATALRTSPRPSHAVSR